MWLPLVTAVALVAAAPASNNPYLGAVERLYVNLEFEEALANVDRATQWPGNSAADVVRIALFEGILSAELGQKPRATSAFKRALSLDERAVLPVEVSPALRELFIKTRLELKLPAEPPPLTAVPAVEASPPAVSSEPRSWRVLLGLHAGFDAVAKSAGPVAEVGVRYQHLDVRLRGLIGPHFGIGLEGGWAFGDWLIQPRVGVRLTSFPTANAWGGGALVGARLNLSAHWLIEGSVGAEYFAVPAPTRPLTVVGQLGVVVQL